jgi:hypothetical protein
MTISSQDFRWSYVSTGGATYQYLNKILDQDDLAVYVDGVLQTIGTHYTVTGVGVATGGNVVFLAAPAAASVVLITKDGVTFTQEHDYTENDAFPAASHEDALDKQMNVAQKIWDYVRRSVKVAITSTITDLEFPTPSAGKVLAWDGAATALENVTLSGVGGISDTAYNSTTWNGVDTIAPSKNVVRDEFEVLRAAAVALISDTAYNSTTWDNVTTIAPSKNAVRDQIEILVAALAASISDTAYNSTSWDNVTTIAPSKNAVRDALESSLVGVKSGTFSRDLTTASGTVEVSGLGFTPSVVFISGCVNSSYGFMFGYITADGAFGTSIYQADSMTGALRMYGPTLNDYNTISLSSFSAGKFTLTFTKTASASGTGVFNYTVLR